MTFASCYFTITTMILFQWCSTSTHNATSSTVNLANLTRPRRSIDFTNSTNPSVNYTTLITPVSNLLISTNSTVKNPKSDLGASSANSSNSTFLSDRKNLGYRLDLNQTNRRYHPNFCHLRISEEALEDVLELMYIRTVNIIEIEVSLVSNDKCRSFPKMKWPWASEIGRTLVTLITGANESMFASPVFTEILAVGIKLVNIEVVEEIDGCLQDGEKGSDEIFKFLLQQLSRSDNTHSYGLCKAQKDETFPWTVYNCCRITGRRNLTVCADYTSPVVKHALPFVIAVFVISSFLVLPFVLEYIRLFPSNNFYKTSESHMSLFSIASRILFGESGRGVSMLRRSIIVLFYIFLFLPADFYRFLWLEIIFVVWGIFFISYDVLKFNKKHKKCGKCPLGTILITDLTKHLTDLTQHLTKLLTDYTKHLDGFFAKLKFQPEQHNKDNDNDDNEKSPEPSVPLLYLMIGILSLPCFLLITILALLLVALNLLFFTVFDFLNSYVLCNCDMRNFDSRSRWWYKFVWGIEYLVLFCVRLLTFPVVVVFTGSVFIFTISIVVGLLNGEFFNPFVAPVVTIYIYFWRNWKFSVETKFLELKTAIVEVCKDQNPALKNENENVSRSVGTGRNEENNGDSYKSPRERIRSLCVRQHPTERIPLNEVRHSRVTSTDFSRSGDSLMSPEDQSPNDGKNVHIEFDHNGEAKIPKGFYKKISKDELPLNEILFNFFRRVTFVSVYAFVMYTVMILARDSGVTESVQVITAIAGVLIPFVFDTIWAEESSTQKTAYYAALKEKLNHKIKVLRRNKEEIIVSLISDCAGNSQGSNHIAPAHDVRQIES